MARIYRGDGEGTWHHVMNRAIARRAVFENRQDVRFFLACLARCVRAKLIEVHAYTVLTTHYHLLVRSPVGELSRAMQRIQNPYVRWFNRSRRRDGPLFRGRFRSKPIESEEYWLTVIRYIDDNPVDARIVATPAAYPYGSACHYARSDGPIWLARAEVERAVGRGTGCGYDPREYGNFLARPMDDEDRKAIERRIGSRREEPALESLVRTNKDAVQRWFRRKAALADGIPPGRTWVGTSQVTQELNEARRRHPDWLVRSGRVQRSGWILLEAGLLRHACGLRMQEIASHQGCSRTAAHQRVRVHQQLVETDPSYCEITSRVLGGVLRCSRDEAAGEVG